MYAEIYDVFDAYVIYLCIRYMYVFDVFDAYVIYLCICYMYTCTESAFTHVSI